MKSKKDKASKIIAFLLLILGFIASFGIAATGTFFRIKEFIENGRKVIIVGLKRYNHIDAISEIFDNDFF